MYILYVYGYRNQTSAHLINFQKFVFVYQDFILKLLNLLLLLQMEEILPHPQGHDVHILLRYRQFGIPECIIPEQELLQGSGFQIHTTKPCGNAPVQRLPVVFWTPSNRIPQHHPHPPLLRPLVCNILLFNEFFPPNFRNMKFMNLIHMILISRFFFVWTF